MSDLQRDCEHGQLAMACRICELERELADALEENARLMAENDTLRGLLGNSALPCPYCGLAAEDQSKCARGFPGCARADDQMLSKHFADGYRAERAEAELTKLRQHAEAMFNWITGDGEYCAIKECEACAIGRAYRADYPEEK